MEMKMGIGGADVSNLLTNGFWKFWVLINVIRTLHTCQGYTRDIDLD